MVRTNIILSFVSYSYFLLCKNGFMLLFSGECTYPYTYDRHTMAGVLEQLIRPQKRAVVYCSPKALELQTAKEILAKVFRVRLSEVDEMIQNRFEAEDMGFKEGL
jgi:hypothetical protein